MSADAPHPLKKKESPSPISRSLEVGAPVRPLVQVGGSAADSSKQGGGVRRLAVPLAVAAALALTGGGVALAVTQKSKPISREEPAKHHVSPEKPGDGGSFIEALTGFIDPTPDPPRLAGDVAGPTPPPTATPSATVAVTPTFVPPDPDPPRPGGAPPALPPSAVHPSGPTPPPVLPSSNPPRLGGKVAAPSPGR